MIVHFAASTRNLEEDLVYYREIIKAIHECGSTLALDWIEPLLVRRNKNSAYMPDWPKIMNETVEAIKRADLVIIEATEYSLNQGLQVGVALRYKKPTLLLSRRSLQGNMCSGIRSKLYIMMMYKEIRELLDIVKSFIEQNEVPSKDLRFNFFINRNIYHYLREVSYATGKNKSEIIREVIERDMESES